MAQVVNIRRDVDVSAASHPLPIYTNISMSSGQVLPLQVRLEFATGPTKIGLTNQIIIHQDAVSPDQDRR